MAMHRNPLRLARALLSLLLVLISVGGPVIAQTYECPMAREAREAKEKRASCCVHQAQIGMDGAGGLAYSRTCDCPKLSWEGRVIDQTRQNGAEGAPVLSSWFQQVDLSLQPSDRPLQRMIFAECTFGARTPIWLQNRSIRC